MPLTSSAQPHLPGAVFQVKAWHGVLEERYEPALHVQALSRLVGAGAHRAHQAVGHRKPVDIGHERTGRTCRDTPENGPLNGPRLICVGKLVLLLERRRTICQGKVQPTTDLMYEPRISLLSG